MARRPDALRDIRQWLFHLLNDPLASNPTWLHIWAIASLRPFDAVVGVILLMLLIRGEWVFKAIEVRQAFFGFLAILLLLLFIRMLFSKLALRGADGLAAQ